MDIGTIAFLSPFVLVGLVLTIFGIVLVVKIYGRFVTSTVKPGEIGQVFEGIGMFFDIVIELCLGLSYLFILGVPALIIGGGILIAIIDGVFGTDLTGMLNE